MFQECSCGLWDFRGSCDNDNGDDKDNGNGNDKDNDNGNDNDNGTGKTELRSQKRIEVEVRYMSMSGV